ncbi:hypothetical protein AVEN_172541-1 [Araneus ventricosus]|uniref:Secreted protein n=1 Tax=Araneus ventricosus TaxID=182803 RepID=A0A4Y2PV86_ARAVE|nr:hypothetical protein AVEN_12240-1 [Araneus ventricosus]GBN54733.1 hypothetical protein AVEN_62297-1 [Araneus ventricosus]GBN54783.1 hypothetical protein AVEN_144092-1 [Araneus ventricosus]GBN54809.1 hypothetical protein AVEN_172541-1 [Araneus ventricosus]
MGYLLILCGTSFWPAVCSNSMWLAATRRRKTLEEIFGHAASTAIHICETVAGAGFCAKLTFRSFPICVRWDSCLVIYFIKSFTGIIQNIPQTNRDLF